MDRVLFVLGQQNYAEVAAEGQVPTGKGLANPMSSAAIDGRRWRPS